MRRPRLVGGEPAKRYASRMASTPQSARDGQQSFRESARIRNRFYPEAGLVGFTRVDATVRLYSQVLAVLRPQHRVLDFGAGRGSPILNDQCRFRRDIQILKGRCSHVEGCDIDSAVLTNSFLDHAELLPQDRSLPYEDASFDVIVSNSVFEHVTHPEPVASELLRVLKPDGFMFATTPNKLGYIALAARLFGGGKVLRAAQPEREEADIFPAFYRMNTPAALRRLFGAMAEVVVYPVAPEPAYFFNSRTMFAAMKAAHRLLPSAFWPTLHVIARRY